MMMPSEALALVQQLADSFPNAKMTPSNVSAYAGRLVAFPRAVVEAAIEDLVRTSEFLPSLAKVYGTIEDLLDDEPSAEDAWTEVNKAIRRYGSRGVPKAGGGYDPVTFSSPLVEQAVNVLGWGHLCSSDNEVADRAHFFKVFGNLKDDKRTQQRRAHYSDKVSAALAGPARKVLGSGGTSDGGK